MSETLLTPSSIKIYGRLVSDLSYKYNRRTVKIGGDNFLWHQLRPLDTVTFHGTATITQEVITNVTSLDGIFDGMNITCGTAAIIPNDTTVTKIDQTAITITMSQKAIGSGNNLVFTVSWNPQFARIYAFSFEGAIYSLPKPAIFLVHGTGSRIRAKNFPGLRSSVDQSGVVAREWEFASKLSYWEYEKGDFSLRLDTEAGPFEQILLGGTLRGADMADRSGANLGIRSGANLSGANVSGANLSGANLSGANVSGANLRNR
jgi:hypothetical protein